MKESNSVLWELKNELEFLFKIVGQMFESNCKVRTKKMPGGQRNVVSMKERAYRGAVKTSPACQ